MDVRYQPLKEKIEALQQNSITTADLKKVSAPLGIYEQKNGLFMVRIRIAGGDIQASELLRLSEVCRDNDINNIHITTRQDFQLHDVQLKNVYPVVIQSVEKGFIFRGGGGDTFRNMMIDEYSDVSPDAVFDVRPHAFALTKFVLGYDHAFALPRKLKIGFFSGTTRNNAVLFQDLSFNAVKIDNTKAFDVYAGGGLGRESKKGVKIFSALPGEEIFRCAAACVELFNDHGNREKRNEARLRFVVNRLGEEKFTQLFLQYFEKSEVNNSVRIEIDEKTHAIPVFEDKVEKDPLFDKWFEHSVIPTGIEDVYALKIVVPGGTLEKRHLSVFADLASKYSIGSIRLLRSQDILLPRVHKTALPHIYGELRKNGNLSAFLQTAYSSKIVSCVGAAVCKIGILEAAKFASELSASLDIFFKGIPNLATWDKLQIIESIRISGCPNSCSGHPAYPLGFEGIKRNVDGESKPFFRVFTGGYQGGEKATLATAKEDFYLPSEHLQTFVKEIAAGYLKRNNRSESFIDYISKIGTGKIIEFYKS